MTTLKADEAAAIVNAVLDQYIKYTREQSDATSDQLYRKLTAEQESLRSEIAGSEKVVANLSKDLGTSTPEQLVSQMRLRLDESETKLKTLRQELVTASWQEKQLAALLPHEEADTKLEALQRELATLGWQEKQLTTLPPQQVPPSPNPTESAKGVSNTTPPVASQPPYETDDLWRQLYHDLTIVKGQVQLENQRLKDSHPRRLELRQQVEVAEKMLRDRQQELDARWKAHPQMLVTTGPVALAATGVRTEPDVVKDMDTVRQQIKLLQYQEYLQVEDVKAQRTEFKRVFENAQLQEKENEEIRHKRGLYEAVRMRVDQKEMERNVPGSIEVLTKASAPSEASNDRRLLMSLLAVLGGLGAGAATCFLRLSTTQTIHEPDDLGQTAATPFLGQLPFIQSKAKAPVEESELLLESMRMLRTALLQRIDYQKGSIVQITSAEPGAGKSTVAAMLARSLAQCGKKVLLVDADLRNPTFTRRFGVSQEPGLIGALTGTTDDEAIIGTDTPLLSILPSGRARRGADAELVANGVLSACLQRWQQRYDLVLLDSPPLLPVADARILARKADGTIMVVRERRSQRASVFEAMSYLQIAGGKLLGVVFIGSGGRSGYPQYSYQYGYGKSSDEPGNKQDSKSD
jgi:capsular exopolysaccharide synthesis family protein